MTIFNEDHKDIRINGPLLQEPKGFFWKIKKEEKTVGYLLGTIHKAPVYVLNLNSRIRKCFHKSSRLAVELNTTTKEFEISYIRQIHELRKNIVKDMETKQFDNAIQALKKLFPKDAEGLDFSNKEHSTLFLALIMMVRFKFQTLSSARIGFEGIDSHLMDQAKADGKPIENLETLEQIKLLTDKLEISDLQMELFNTLCSEEVAESDNPARIVNPVIEKMAKEFEMVLMPVYDVWMDGDTEKMLTQIDILSDYKSEDQKKKSTEKIVNRNKNIAKRIEELANAKEKIFCCVGTAHTVGEKSVQDFLIPSGFSFERVLI